MPIILVHTDDVRCRLCERQMRRDEQFCGPDMWHHWDLTCRHEKFFVCPQCSRLPERHDSGKLCCSTCGCDGCYT